MTIGELAKALEVEVLAGGEGLERDTASVYCCDLLSWVIGRANAGDVWITIMCNVNVVAVALLAEVGCVLLAEGAEAPEEVVAKAAEEGIVLLRSSKSVYQLAVACSKLL